MPKFKDLQIEICSDDKPLMEYGTKKIARSNMVSTWIESRSDQAFSIKIRTQRPWDFSENDTIDDHGRDSIHYSFCVEIHFDGRDSDPERSVVIYLDDEGSGKIKGKFRENTIRSSFVKRSDGALEEQTWVFRDTGGIDHIFEKLCLASAGKDDNLEAEDDLAKALRSAKLVDGKKIDVVPQFKLGQIFINVHRVRVSRRKGVAGVPSDFALKKRDKDNDVDMGDQGDEITHTVGSNTSAVMKPEDMRVINVNFHKAELGPYAQFSFFYRSRKQLCKMGIIPIGEIVPRSRRRKFGTVAAQMVSLNTLNERKRLDKLKSREIAETFEDKIKNKTLGPYKDNGTSKYETRLRSNHVKENDSSEEWEDVDDSAQKASSRYAKSKTKAPTASRREAARPSSSSIHFQDGPQEVVSTPEPRRSERIQHKTQRKAESLTKKIIGKDLFREKVKERQAESDNESEAETEKEAEDLDQDSFGPNADENTGDHQEIREQLTSIDIRKRGRDSPEPNFSIDETRNSGSDADQESTDAASPAMKKKAKMTPLKNGISDAGDNSNINQSTQSL